MFFWIIIIALFLLFLAQMVFFLNRVKSRYRNDQKELSQRYLSLVEKEDRFKKEVDDLESSLGERFLFYDITRKIAPLLKRKELFDMFSEEMRYLGQIEEIKFSGVPPSGGYLKFEVSQDPKEFLYLKTKSKAVIAYIHYFVKLLELCLERIKLYDRLQELSIRDSLTRIYNRRYFMQRFFEEFSRAKKFNLNLAFLMIDIDYFKKTNDTYGHLVGDAVLREVARLIRENVREIDFIARFGGEEFSVILPETDKAGAIMLAERIRARVSQEKIRIFDEILTTTISIGAASFPQNTLHADVLVETADKALYKAKTSGRNRVCWF